MISARLLAATLALAAATGACGGGSPESATSALPTTVADLNAPQMRLARVAFCDLVPDASVEAALGAPATGSRTWGNGDPLPGSSSDVAHELGCQWSTTSAFARAWVFARPVSFAFAKTLVSDARAPGCTIASTHGFGSPSVLQSCPAAGRARRVRMAGLFADTWLTCEVSDHAQATDIQRRTDRWCAAVAASLDTAG